MTDSFCFWFAVYDDYLLAERLVNQLCKLYPDKEIICITDGTHNLEFENLCQVYQVKYIRSNHLHSREHGGLWLQRMFETYLGFSESDRLIRVEPDTFFRRRFESIPDSDVAGNLLTLPNGKLLIQGGCMMFSRYAAKAILDSGLLEDPRYTQVEYCYQRYQPPYLMPEESSSNKWLTAVDVIATDICLRLKLNITDWDDIYCRVREACPTPDRYAAIHPIKSFKLTY